MAFYDWSTPEKPQIALFEMNDAPRDLLFFSNYVYVEFITDNYLSGDGFELSWNTDYSPAGLEEISADEIVVYPNPAHSFVHVQLPNHQNATEIMLYDVTGRIVREAKAIQGSFDLNISVLPNGFYTLMLQDGATIYKKKIVIQH